jgi:hypothetical protein
MKAVFLTPLAALIALAGCSTTGGGSGGTSGADVTRFHLGQPVARASIAIEPFEAANANNPEYRSYLTAVGHELGRLGWNVVNTIGQSEQVALVDVTQGTASRMRVGAAGGVRPTDAMATQLEVRIKRRSDGTVFWEGRAADVARAPASPEQRMAAVQRLASALFRDFPGESGRTIRTR